MNNPFDPNRTVMSDRTRTQAMQPGGIDPNRTVMGAPISGATTGISVTVTAGREVTMANGPAREQFLLAVRAGTGEALPGVGTSAARTPMNLCLVIDRSGSMEGPPLEYVKQACQFVVDILTPNDILSIVTFEEFVQVLMPPQRVSDKAAIKEGIARITAGNTTNLYEGLATGLSQILNGVEGSRATRMVVLSDGDPTAGIMDFGSLVQLASDIKQRGVTVTLLGFGPDYNEELLAGMAKRAAGNYYYIPRPELIPEIFRTELDKLMTTAAQNLRLDLKMARWVKLASATGLSVPNADNEISLTLADLERGSTLHQVLDFEFSNHPLGHYRVAQGKLTYSDASLGTTVEQPIDFIIEFSADPARYGVAVHPTVAQAHQVAAASRTVEKTIMGLKTGALTAMGAMQELQKTQMLLVSEGRTADAQEVTVAMRAIQSGDIGQAEKTLMGTVVNLDQGKITP